MRRRLPTVARVLRVVSQWLAPSLVSHVRQLPTSAIRTGQESTTRRRGEVVFDLDGGGWSDTKRRHSGDGSDLGCHAAGRSYTFLSFHFARRYRFRAALCIFFFNSGLTCGFLDRCRSHFASLPWLRLYWCVIEWNFLLIRRCVNVFLGSFIPLCDDDCLQSVLDIFAVGLISIDKATV